MKHAARPRHREPVRARRGPARRGGRPAEAQREQISEYWSDYLKEVQAFEHRRLGDRHHLAGHRQRRAGRGRPVEAILPEEGATGWSDTWMVGAESEHKNWPTCGWTTSSARRPTPRSSEYFGEAPANPKACDIDQRRGHCETYNAGDEEFAEQIWYWTTPIEQCLDGRDGREVHRLRRLDPGLDRDQGLIRPLRQGPMSTTCHRGRPAPRVRRPAPPSAAASGLLITPPMLWLGLAYLGALAALFITAFWDQDSLHRRDRSGAGTSTTSGCSSSRSLPHDRAPHDRRSRRW